MRFGVVGISVGASVVEVEGEEIEIVPGRVGSIFFLLGKRGTFSF